MFDAPTCMVFLLSFFFLSFFAKQMSIRAYFSFFFLFFFLCCTDVKLWYIN